MALVVGVAAATTAGPMASSAKANPPCSASNGALSCGNDAPTNIYSSPGISASVVDTLKSNPSSFKCYVHGEQHSGGNDVWYYANGDRTGQWGYVPASAVWTPTGSDPFTGVDACADQATTGGASQVNPGDGGVSSLGDGGASSQGNTGGPCTDVQIIGLRGSGENPMQASQHNMGSLVGPVADAIAEWSQGVATSSFYGIPYKAGDADGVTVLLSGSYFDSKEQGMSMLHDYLGQEVAACPSTKLVVIGYSQGAHAAGDELAEEPTSITDHVAAVVMFGDPRFNPDASYVWGTFDPRDYGIARKRSLSDFSAYASKVFSFCNQNDLICQGAGWGHGLATHNQSVYLTNYRAIVADLVSRALGWT